MAKTREKEPEKMHRAIKEHCENGLGEDFRQMVQSGV